MADKLVFDHTVEGLFLRGLNGQVTPRLKEKLRQAGLDLDRPLLPAYPFEVWKRCIGLAAQELFPEASEPEAWRRLGERLVEGYRETVMGSAMFTLLKVLGPRRTLERAQKNFRSGNNYTEVRFTDVSPTVVDVWMNDTDLVSHFTRGAMQAGMRTSGAPELQVNILHSDGQGTTYRVSWRER
ncbi:MAG TPA: DUF2378 family protein [Myxococcaceae bacterium]|jgi:uncharacterized protein (TIGR02265 family)